MKKKNLIFKTITAIFVGFLMVASAATARANDEVYLKTIGGFGGSYVYMTYAYIGVTADAFSKNIYKPDQVKVMMDESVTMIDNLMELLTKVQGTDIVDDDKAFVGAMLEILNLLKSEAQALSAFSISQNPADVEKYDQARKDVWPQIKQLLKIK